MRPSSVLLFQWQDVQTHHTPLPKWHNCGKCYSLVNKHHRKHCQRMERKNTWTIRREPAQQHWPWVRLYHQEDHEDRHHCYVCDHGHHYTNWKHDHDQDLVKEESEMCGFNGVAKVGVVHHNQRRLATKLKSHSLVIGGTSWQLSKCYFYKWVALSRLAPL